MSVSGDTYYGPHGITIGTRFGKWRVIRATPHLDYMRHKRVRCMCECGYESEIRAGELVRGHSKQCTSCAASARQRKKKQALNARWRGCGDLSGTYWCRVLSGAKRRNIPVLITIKEAWEQLVRQGGKCAMTGEPLSFGDFQNDITGTASLDRIESSKGYELGNIQWVHKELQNMKFNKSDDRFFEWCEKVVEHRKNIKKNMAVADIGIANGV